MRKTGIFLFFFVFLFAGSNGRAQNAGIKYDDPRISYSGRIDWRDAAAGAILSWPGTSVRVDFKGTGMKVLLKDEHGDNYYNVILDDKVAAVLHPDTARKFYTLVSGLEPGKHSLELFKRTESGMGKTSLLGFEPDSNTLLLAVPERKRRKMEFFGNSITCGYAVEDTTGQDRGTSPYENGYISYAAITARHFDAEFHSTSKSGIGVMISWFPLIMPEMVDRLDATDSNSKWDFSQYTPDLVVINLFQNDAWLVNMPGHKEFKARFGATAPGPDQIVRAYSDLVRSIRSKYPKTPIICALGNMDATRQGSPWPGYIEKAVAGLNDAGLYTHFFPYKNSNGHPNAADQRAMADDLIAFIDGHIQW